MNKNRYYKFAESFKYFTALFQIKTNFFKYLRAVFLYKLKRKVEFPKTIIKLAGAKFITRENSMDIAHLSNFYERETTNLLLGLNPSVFLDVGTHVGRFSIILANRGSEVISIEPSRENFNQLKKNIELNNLQNKVKALNVGCSNQNRNGTLYFVPSNEGLTSLGEKEGAIKEAVTLKKLDTICGSLNLNPEYINAIKIDVEGFELKPHFY